MNKANLVEKVANQTELTKEIYEEVVDAVIPATTDSLARGEKVILVGFRTIKVMERKARRRRNSQSKQTIQIVAGKIPEFRPGKDLRED